MTGAETPLGAAPAAGLARRWQLLAWLLLAALLAVVGAKLVQVSRGPAASGAAPFFTLTDFDGAQHQFALLSQQLRLCHLICRLRLLQ